MSNNDLSEIYEEEALKKSQLVSYEYNFASLKRQKILEEANLDKNKKVLEIGCGEGQLINYVKANHKLGVDISPSRIKQANNNARKIGANTKFLVRNAENLSLGSKKFDVIICSEVIEHLPHPEKFLRETKKVMNENARLILTTPNYFSIKRLLAKVVTGRSGDKTHLRTYSHQSLKKLLEKEGFSVEKQIPLTLEYCFYNRIPFGHFFDRLDYPLRQKIARLFPNLSDLLFFVVKKER